MISLDRLFATFDMRLDSVRYSARHRTMTAQITFTIPIERFVEDVHEGLAMEFDLYEDDDWKLSLGDYDDGPEVAWFVFTIEARSVEACRDLHARLVPATFWFQENPDA